MTSLDRKLWLASLAVLVPPLVYWGNRRHWELDGLTTLAIFPLLGMWAFSLMWLHFAAGAVRRRRPDDANWPRWYRLTSNVVLVLILLHPILLLVNGLTVWRYVGPGQELFATFGISALTVFLIYEVVERQQERPVVQRYWPLVKAFNVAAFVAVYVHGLMLGQHLQAGWLRVLWLAYGISTALFIIDSYRHDFKRQD